MMKQNRRKISGFIILIILSFVIGHNLHFGRNIQGKIDSWGFTYPVFSQAKFDLSCPNGTQPFQPLITNNPQTGNLKANACIDSTGTVTYQGLGFSAGQTPITNTFYLADLKYGAKSDGKIFYSNINTCSFTSGQAIITCTGGGFTSSLIGYNVTATINSCCGVSFNYQGTLAFTNIATTVISVQSSTQLTISQNFSANSGGNWIIGILPNIDAAWTAAEADANASGGCYAIGFPTGRMAVLQGHGNTFGTQCGGAEPQADFTVNFFGQGKGATVIVPVPGFQTSTCTGGLASDTCFFGAKNASNASEVTINFLQLNGLGWGNTGFGSLKKLIGVGLGSETIDLACNAFGGSDSNLIGFSYDGAGVRNVKMSIDGCGASGALVNGPIAKCYYCFYGDTLNANLTIASGGDYFNVGDDYGVTGTTVVISQAGRYHGVGSTLFGCSAAANATAIFMSNFANAQTILEGARFNCTTTTSNGVFMNASTQKLVLSSGTHIGGTTAAINRSAGLVFTSEDTVFDAGSITSLAPSCAMTTGGGAGPTCTALGGSTNEKGIIRMTPGAGPGTNGTTTITLAGTFSGASGTTPACFFDPANTGTGAWNLAADTQYQTASTTVPVFTWNNTIALTAASTYDVSYMCIAR